MGDLDAEHKEGEDAEYKEIREQSFQLMRKAYEEANASFESINIRCGVALAFIGTVVSTSDFEIWVFNRPLYSDKWFAWLIVNVLNLVSLCLLICGTAAILYGLVVRISDTPYKMEDLNEQRQMGVKDQNVYTCLDRFYRQQMANTKDAFDKLQKALEVKAACFNIGVTMVLFAIGLVIFSKLVL